MGCLREAEEFDREVAATIAHYGGDARAAVKAVLIANAYLQDELTEAVSAISNGYARGRYSGVRRPRS